MVMLTSTPQRTLLDVSTRRRPPAAVGDARLLREGNVEERLTKTLPNLTGTSLNPHFSQIVGNIFSRALKLEVSDGEVQKEEQDTKSQWPVLHPEVAHHCHCKQARRRTSCCFTVRAKEYGTVCHTNSINIPGFSSSK